MAFSGAYFPLTPASAELQSGPAATLVTGADITQGNSVSATAVSQTHLVTSANGVSANAVAESAVIQTHLVSVANGSQDNAVSASAIESSAPTVLVTVANATQTNFVSAAQSHTPLNRIIRVDPDPLEDGYLIIGDEGGQLVAVAGVAQSNSASPVAVSQTQFVAADNVAQSNSASPTAVNATHLVAVAAAAQNNAVSQVTVAQTHLVGVSAATQSNLASQAGVSQSSISYVSAADSYQINAVSAAAIRQDHLVSAVAVAQSNALSPAGVAQTHLVAPASVGQSNAASGASAINVVTGSGHVWRIDTAPFYSGALLIGDPGFGLLGSQIPASGDDGPSYLYNDLSLPTDADKEIIGEIVTWPLHGEVFADEDGSFVYTPNVDYVGADSFQYQLRVDGEPVGSPTTVNLLVVGDTHYVTSADVQQGNSASAASVVQTGASLVSAGSVVQQNQSTPVSVTQTHLIGAANATQTTAVSPASVATDGGAYVSAASVSQSQNASPAAVRQTHLVTAAPVQQQNTASSEAIGGKKAQRFYVLTKQNTSVVVSGVATATVLTSELSVVASTKQMRVFAAKRPSATARLTRGK